MAIAGIAFVIAAVLLAGPGGLVGSVDAGEDVSSCTIINSSGSYTLTTDLTQVSDAERIKSGSDGRCIEIRASDVVFDGNGHLIDSTDPQSLPGYFNGITGITINGTEHRRRNVTVVDVNLTDWATGVRVRNATDVRIERVTTGHRDGTWDRENFMAVRVFRASNLTVRDNTLTKYVHGVQAGRRSDDPHRNNRYVNNTIRDVGHGIELSRGADNTVERNTIRAAGNGIEIINDDPTVVNNTIIGGVHDGISVGGNNVTVEANEVRDMPNDRSHGGDEYAIDIRGRDHVVRNNLVENNSRGIEVEGAGHRLRDNTMVDNAENFHLHEPLSRGLPPTDFESLDIDTSNTADGDPIYVRHGLSGRTFTPTDDPGFIGLTNSSDVRIEGVTLHNNTDGLYLYNTSNVTVDNASIHRNGNGIDADAGHTVSIQHSRLRNNTLRGFFARYWVFVPQNYTFDGNDVAGNGGDGIYYSGTNATVTGNTLTGNAHGMELNPSEHSRRTVVGNNTARNNDRIGIRVSGWGSADGGEEIRENNASANGDAGILVVGSGAPVVNNTVNDNDGAGIWIQSRTRPNRVEGTTASGNRYGIRLGHFVDGSPIGSSDNTLFYNHLTNNTYGIHVGERSRDNVIRRNTVSGNRNGIYLERPGNNRVVTNEIAGNERDGVHLQGYRGDVETDMTAFVVRNNTAEANGDDGIELSGARASDPTESGPFSVANNDVRANGNDGIRIERSTDVTVADDGNGSADGNGEVGVEVFSSETIEVRGVTATNNTAGFAVRQSSNVTLGDVTANRNGAGVYIGGGDHVDVRDGTITNGTDLVADFANATSLPGETNVSGIVVHEGSNGVAPENLSLDGNTIADHRVVLERSTVGYGVDVRAASTTPSNAPASVVVSGNEITGTHQGVRLVDDGDGTVVVHDNRIRRNDVGVAFGRTTSGSVGSEDNRITSNALAENPTAFRVLTFDPAVTVSPSAEGYAIYNNVVNASDPFDVSTGTKADAVGYLRFSRHSIVQERTTGLENPMGGAMIGGNAWLRPDGSGYSQTCSDADTDGLCDSPYYLVDYNGTDFDTCEDVDGDGDNDTDGDGLCDNWEDALRVDSAPLTNESVMTGAAPPPPANPGPGIDLIAMGASLDHKDLFLEVDYMTSPTHSHRPDPAAVRKVTDSFADAPVENPDGTRGIDLHVVIDDDVTEKQYLKLHGGNDKVSPNGTFSDLRTGDSDEPCGGVNGTAAERNANNCAELLADREKAFHYSMFIHKYTHAPGSSGLSWSRYFVVSLGGWRSSNVGSTEDQAGTLMHEFGHQLGLPHGGSDGINNKPNYLSIMSYTYQLNSRWPGRPVEYSNEKVRTLNESALDESRSLETSRNWPIFYNSSGGINRTWSTGTPIDWNGNDEIDTATVSQDIEGFNRSSNSSFELLEGHDDWANLNLVPAESPASGGATVPVSETAEEPTNEDAERIAAESDFDGDGVSNLEDNCPESANPAQADTDGDGDGDDCDPGDVDLVTDLSGPSTHTNDTVQYTATLTHDGAINATGVALTMDVPSQVRVDTVSSDADCRFAEGTLTCEVGTLSPEASVRTTVNGTVVVNESYSVTARTRANETDTWPGDNDASLTTFAGSPTPDPAIAVEPLSVDYGTVTAGDTDTRAITIANNGTGALNITGLQLSGPDAGNFTLADTGPFTLAPGAARDIATTYAPNATGTDTATVSIDHNDTDTTTLTVDLTGNASEATGAAAYANADGVIDTDGLRAAIDDWRAGVIGTDVLRDVIDYWRSGEPVQ